MADEPRRMNPIVKYLLFAIAFLLQVALVAGISIFVFMKFQAAREEQAHGAAHGGAEIKATVKFDEFKFPSADGGLVSFKMEVDVSDEDLKTALEKQMSYVRDGVPRLFMKLTVDQLKEAYVDQTIHKRITEWLELNVVKFMPKKKTWMFGDYKVYAIARVNVFDLSAMKME